MSETTGAIATRHADLLRDEFAAVRREAMTLGLAPPAVHREAFALRPPKILSYIRWGVEAPRVLFLHGGGLNAHSWDSLLVRLGVSAVAVDLPGHGHSSWRDDFDYTPETLAADIAPLVEEIAADCPVWVIGQSMGALAGAALAATHADSIAGLVTVDITPGRRPSPANSQPVRDFISGPSSFGTYEEVVEHAIVTGIGRDRDRLERGIVLNTRRRDDGRLIFRHHFASPPAGAKPALEDVSHLWGAMKGVPGPRQLLVTGTRGIVAGDEVVNFLQRNPGAHHVELDAGHNVQRDAPGPLADVLHERLIGSDPGSYVAPGPGK